MPIERRLLLTLAPACAALWLPARSWAQATPDQTPPADQSAPVPVSPDQAGSEAQPAGPDPRMGPRQIGSPTAPVSVTEYFSLTCPHCARFQKETFPKVKKELIDTGKLRYGWVDYPLDQLALMAAQIARALPPAEYPDFIDELLTTQSEWMYPKDNNYTAQLYRDAAVAGLSQDAFDTAIADTKLRDEILTVQDQAEKTLGIDSTPTFIFDGAAIKGRKASGELTYSAFAKTVALVSGQTG
jgi:protein-disulfide isomerase